MRFSYIKNNSFSAETTGITNCGEPKHCPGEMKLWADSRLL